MNTSNVLSIKNLNKIFSNGRGIFNIDFNVPKGSFVAVIGPNGSGKTTLVRSILRFYQEYEGEILINGKINEDPRTLNNISYIGETARFPTGISMEKYLYFMAVLKGIKTSVIKSQIRALAKSFKLSSHLKRKINSFSSGEKQKVMLIKSIIENPDLLIMDEPTSNLDPEAREVFFSEIQKLNAEGKSVLVISHNLEELESRASHVLVLSYGFQKYFAKKDKNSLNKLFHKFNEVKNE